MPRELKLVLASFPPIRHLPPSRETPVFYSTTASWRSAHHFSQTLRVHPPHRHLSGSPWPAPALFAGNPSRSPRPIKSHRASKNPTGTASAPPMRPGVMPSNPSTAAGKRLIPGSSGPPTLTVAASWRHRSRPHGPGGWSWRATASARHKPRWTPCCLRCGQTASGSPTNGTPTSRSGGSMTPAASSTATSSTSGLPE